MKRDEKALALIQPELTAMQDEAMVLAARAYEIGGQFGKALAAFGQAVRRYPSRLPVLSSAAAFNWRMGRYRQAADLIARGRSITGMRGGLRSPSPCWTTTPIRRGLPPPGSRFDGRDRRRRQKRSNAGTRGPAHFRLPSRSFSWAFTPGCWKPSPIRRIIQNPRPSGPG